MRDISVGGYRERSDEALTRIYREAVSKYYDFTYNHLYTRFAIEKMLQNLEERYGLNFRELEKSIQPKMQTTIPP